MKALSSRFHLAVGMTSMVVSLLLLASFAGLVPDRDSAVRAGRTALAESVAVSSSVLLSDEDDRRLEQVLRFIVKRNPDLLSIDIRENSGRLLLHVGAPLASEDVQETASTDTHLRVPLLHRGQPWGRAFLHFAPVRTGGSLLSAIGATGLLIGAMALSCFGLFYFYLRRMLRHLDPSQVIPGRVRTAFDTLAEGLLVLEPSGRIVLANQAFCKVVGGDSESLVGRMAQSLAWSFPSEAASDANPWVALLGDGQAHRNVLMYLTDAQGKRRTFMINGSPVPGAGGKAAGMLVSLDDVTALEEKEIQLRLARDAAEAANQAKSDFLANMSHEIRTPMNAILGFAELLRRGWQGGDRQQSQRHLDTILSSGRHLLALINDILDLSKVEAGRLEVERLPCPVHEVINEAVAIMRVRADERQIRLSVDYPQALPATLNVDAGRVRQIVTNLVGNAIKFTHEGSVTVSVRLNDRGPPARLSIDVRDSGIGIPADKLDAIFEPFVQAEASTTRQFGGTGLGLPISRRFARALGGDITASSVHGQGSTFHITLDVGVLDDSVVWLDPEQLKQARIDQRDAVAKRWVFDGQRVLVVDDGNENRELVRLVLESAGLSVVEAENGAVALQRVAQDHPALVLMDVQMPVMDGYTATRRLRDSGYELPILALTANAMKGFEAEISHSGFSGYLTKPVDIDALLAELAARLGGREESAAAAPAAALAAPLPAAAVAGDPAAPMPVPMSMHQAAATPVAAQRPPNNAPLVSRLAKHPRLAKVARSFCQTLPVKLEAMQQALAAHRMNELAELAHWLKGAAGTVGYDDFFEPAREFELQARAGRRVELQAGLQQIMALAARIEAPPEMASEKPAVLDKV